MRRPWTNPAHDQVPAWYLFLVGCVSSVAVLAIAEALLIAAGMVRAAA